MNQGKRPKEPAVIRRLRRGGSIRAVGCIAAVCAVAFAFLVPAATALPMTKFISKLYGYSIVLPGASSHWTRSPAIVVWSTNQLEGIGSPAFDTLTDQQSGRVYLLAAKRSPGGPGVKQWTAFIISARPSVCGPPRSLPISTLGGAPAHILTWVCTDGYRSFVATAVHAHRGYVLIVASPSTKSTASDREAFDAVRHSFHFLHS